MNIMKLLFAIILFTFQCVHCNAHSNEKTVKTFNLSNGIEVVLYEIFRMPIVLAGVIFHIGREDTTKDKIGIIDIISANLINKEIHNTFMSSGISYEVSASSKYTEIFAEMNPEKINKFFDQIRLSLLKMSIENFDAQKRQMIIENKLNTYFFSNALKDNILSNINTHDIFNESSLASVTASDVISFFKKEFQNCKISIIVVGAIERENLMKILHNSMSNLPNKKLKETHENNHRITFKDVQLESKYIRNSIRYVYSIPLNENNKCEEIFLNILRSEMFKFFCKDNSVASYFDIHNIPSDKKNIYMISLFPKKDISLNELQKFYSIFANKMITTFFDSKTLSNIAVRKEVETLVSFSNLFTVYRNIKNAYMKNMDLNSIYTISNDIKHADPKEIKSFAEKFFRKNLISTITTRFRPDK